MREVPVAAEEVDGQPEPTLKGDVIANGVLTVVVGGFVLIGWATLALAAGNVFDSILFKHGADGEPIELGLLPIGVAVGMVIRPRLGQLPVRWQLNGVLSLLAAAAMVAIFLWLAWTWGRPSALLSVERVFGSLLVLTLAVGAAVFFPRHMAALVGVIAAPTLCGIAAYFVPDSLISAIGWETAGIDYRNYVPWEYTKAGQTLWGAEVLYHVMKWIGYWVPGVLIIAAILLRKHAVMHACWTGAVAVFFATPQFYMQMVGEGFGR